MPAKKSGKALLGSQAYVVEELERLDDAYLELQRALDKAVQEVRHEFNDRLEPLLDERRKMLSGDRDEEKRSTGRPLRAL